MNCHYSSHMIAYLTQLNQDFPSCVQNIWLRYNFEDCIIESYVYVVTTKAVNNHQDQAEL